MNIIFKFCQQIINNTEQKVCLHISMCESVNESWIKEEAGKAVPEETSLKCSTSLMISQIDININPHNHKRRPLKAFHARGWMCGF